MHLGRNTIFRCPTFDYRNWVFVGTRWNAQAKDIVLDTNSTWPDNAFLLQNNRIVYIKKVQWENAGIYFCYYGDTVNLLVQVRLKVIGKEEMCGNPYL